MSATLRLVIGQLNFTVGDIQNNIQKIINAAHHARDILKADLIIFPELCITGYSPEDLLLRQDFLQQAQTALTTIAQDTPGIAVLVGYPHHNDQGLYNAAALLRDGKVIATHFKQCLPNYGVFDEKRYFLAGTKPCLVELNGIPISIVICEDIWFPEPAQQAAVAGAKLIVCINASPFSDQKRAKRLQTLQRRTQEVSLPIVYVHGVGGQDEVIFDGGSMVIDAHGKLCASAGFFHEALFPVDIEFNPEFKVLASVLPAPLSQEATIYQALTLGVHDYVTKNNFPGILLGLSGGIDSALTLAIAVDALGKDKVHAVIMPSRFTSDLSMQLAKEQAQLLGVRSSIISIEEPYQNFLKILAPEFGEKPTDLTEENIQARCRGLILMALSNKSNHMVLTTSNKSEIAVGYATLYGDMVGGFAVLKDVWKTMVFKLAHYRNTLTPAIPEQVISRPPSAELRDNQKDEDSLPPYDILDAILQRYVEDNQSIAEIVAAGFTEETVKKLARLVKLSEYKRRQSPPGIKITRRAFGRERRYPLTSGFIDF